MTKHNVEVLPHRLRLGGTIEKQLGIFSCFLVIIQFPRQFSLQPACHLHIVSNFELR